MKTDPVALFAGSSLRAMLEGPTVVKEPQQLPPVHRRGVWITWGLALQVIAAVEAPGDVDWGQLLNSFSGWTPTGRRNRRK